MIRSPFGEAYAELYLAEPAEDSWVALTRDGTRVIANIGTLPGLEHPPWSSRYLQGLIDVPYLNLTPSTRSGIVHDERYGAFVEGVVPLETHLNGLIDAQRRAEQEQANRESLRAIQRAFREAMLVLPREEYDWFDIQSRSSQAVGARRATGARRRGPKCRGKWGRSGTKRKRIYPAPILRPCWAFAHRRDFTSSKHLVSEPNPAPSRAATGSFAPAGRAGLDICLGDRRRRWHCSRQRPIKK